MSALRFQVNQSPSSFHLNTRSVKPIRPAIINRPIPTNLWTPTGCANVEAKPSPPRTKQPTPRTPAEAPFTNQWPANKWINFQLISVLSRVCKAWSILLRNGSHLRGARWLAAGRRFFELSERGKSDSRDFKSPEQDYKNLLEVWLAFCDKSHFSPTGGWVSAWKQS